MYNTFIKTILKQLSGMSITVRLYKHSNICYPYLMTCLHLMSNIIIFAHVTDTTYKVRNTVNNYTNIFVYF